MKKKNYLIGAAVFLVSFGLYTRTLCPTIYTQDSGEFITTACTLGVSHPSGYPLYNIIGKCFSFLPFKNPAFRVNLMSAFFGALTVALVYFIILKLCFSVVPAVAGAMFLLFSRILWSLSTVAEVYSLNAFFTALLILVILNWNNRITWLYLLSFLFGLSLTNHQTMLICGIALVYFALVSGKNNTFSLGNLKIILPLFLLGLSMYLYLYVRALGKPALCWGAPDSLNRFIRIIMRSDYGMMEMGAVKGVPRSAGLMLKQLGGYCAMLLNQFNIAGFLTGIAGMYFMYKKQLKFFVCSLIIFLLSGPCFTLLANMPMDPHSKAMVEVFYLPSIIVFSLWIGMAIAGINKKFRLLFIIIPLVTLILNFKILDKSDNYYAYNYGENVLKTLDRNAIIFTKRDETRNSIWYMQLVEKKRQDVKLVVLPLPYWWTQSIMRKWPELVMKLNNHREGNIKGIIKDYMNTYPVYTDNITEPYMREFYDYWVPYGIVFKFSREGRANVPDERIREMGGIIDSYNYRNEYKTTLCGDLFSREIIHYYAESHFNYGAIYHNRGLYAEGRDAFAAALEIEPDYEDARKIYDIDRELAAGKKGNE